MKSLVIFLVLGLIFMQVEALKCRKSACVGTRPCSSSVATCGPDATLCFIMAQTEPLITLTRGCTTEANCKIMQSFYPTVRCCNYDLCN
ncbi:hypothetical protein GDO86_007272 [Hymenochirus boettgeri]|uniref:Uncharacterized protein n=1 Tax=Hymenochirus boettgeri TaxID=247094 RepID=A0A8T2IYG0_9PIPI|nr:hypothetical protein GDO86_007272 [Hymenochirus boettgeri]